MSLKLILYSTITIFFNGAVLRRYLRDELLLTGPYTLLILLPTITQPICQLLFGGFCGITLFAIASYRIYQSLPQRFIESEGKHVFISGCDSGMGFALAKALDAKGVHVFAGCFLKGQDGEQELVKACSDRLVTIPLDVTDEESIKDAVQTVKDKLQGKELWGLVNNAGIMYMGEAEIMAIKFYHKVMDVNYFGAVQLTKAFLPLLRRSKGRLVSTCSSGSDVPYPMMAAYCSTKAALTIFMDCLRYEMLKWDVSVSTIHPLGYATKLTSRESLEKNMIEMFGSVSSGLLEEYGPNYKGAVEKFYATNNSLPSDLLPVTSSMEHALFAKSPLSKYMVNAPTEIFVFLCMFLPVGISKYLMGSLLLPRDSIRKQQQKARSSEKEEAPVTTSPENEKTERETQAEGTSEAVEGGGTK